ncbi:MAG: hypothetical protein ABR498_08630 [Candidatus Dormibacteria bacterium]
MATLLTIAELLAGETLVSPGGPVDRLTAVPADDVALWQWPDLSARRRTTTIDVAEETLVTV